MSKKHVQHESETVQEEELPPAEAEEVPETKDSAPEEETQSPEEVLQDRMLRLQADFDNFRKRMAREKKDWIAFATENLIMELLPVMDHFELGLEDGEKNGAPESLINGFRLIYSQLGSAMEKSGVQTIDAVPGDAFDPHLHEAITHLPSEEIPADAVISQTRRGYRMGDKLLRAAQVVVSSGPAAG